MIKRTLGKAGLILALGAMAACASTPEEANTASDYETVAPTTTARTEPVGPEPGTLEDFQQSAGDRVFFGYNQYNLTNEAQGTLSRQAAWLKEFPEVRLRLVGNADERGTREYNLALGARRANAAKSYLVGLGIDPSRITTISYGKERPIDPRSTPDAWAKNRNATTMLVSVGS
ncbi:peptidoglycan-associated lipoprotein Pal [Parvularcula dongshanensis]|uniref:Peptidoglycan-associated lipoprotein n=1 Tax=Parvularcula dongshanensis TaxID=1173995 RepID=A0A840I2Z9_9PROT|nr:peptidoglycan-associated lipoprotein Pal [Parvularcula dongshanensis]MBB4659137.1 peptidoglycan-associated lipoprotein [Parvularcula dongshanensis]